MQPSLWNNIPIPICEGFEVVTKAIKKIGKQLELNFETIRRKTERAELDLLKLIEANNDKANLRFEELALDLREIRENQGSFTVATEMRLLHHDELLETYSQKTFVEI